MGPGKRMTGQLPTSRTMQRAALRAAGELLRDPVTACGVALVAAIGALYLLPIVGQERLAAWSEGPVFVPLNLWVIAATVGRARRAPERIERDFWRLIAGGFTCWLLAVLLALLPAWAVTSPHLTLPYDGLSVAFYLCLILATTRAPHDPHAGDARRIGARLVTVGTVIFGVGMTVYFDLVPFLVDRADFESRAPAFYLFLALDFALIARAAAQFRSAQDPRWRLPYGLILLSAALLALGDLLDLLRRLGFSAYTSGSATDFLWYGIYVSIALAPAVRRVSPPPRPTVARSGVLFGSPLLTFAFIVPLVHFSLSGAALLGARSQHPREGVALATMAGVLLVAWWRQSLLERSHVALQLDLERERDRLRNAERLEAVGRLAGGVAHDFNNQLAVILGYSEVIEREAAGRPDLVEAGQAIGDAARVAADLTRELLTVGRRTPLLVSVFDLGQWVDGMAAKLATLVGPSIRLSLALPRAPAPVRADRGSMERALIALVTNSREAMPRGGRLGIELSLPSVAEAGGERQVELAVVDDGVGMSAEVLAHAFEPFFTTKPFGHGSGLGLASAHGIVEQNGGTITLESAPGKGTRAVMRLPLAMAADGRGL